MKTEAMSPREQIAHAAEQTATISQRTTVSLGLIITVLVSIVGVLTTAFVWSRSDAEWKTEIRMQVNTLLQRADKAEDASGRASGEVDALQHAIDNLNVSIEALRRHVADIAPQAWQREQMRLWILRTEQGNGGTWKGAPIDDIPPPR